MSDTPHSASAQPLSGSRFTARSGARSATRIPRLAGRFLLAAMALGIAWLLVSAEVTRESGTDCHSRGYRDPVTGQQVQRPC